MNVEMAPGSIVAVTFWSMLGPFLIAAALVPAIIGLQLWMTPTDEWAEQIIRGWAEDEGLRVTAMEEARWFGYIPASTSTIRVYRVRVLDQAGRGRECKAVVARLILFATAPNLKVTWINSPRGDS